MAVLVRRCVCNLFINWEEDNVDPTRAGERGAEGRLDNVGRSLLGVWSDRNSSGVPYRIYGIFQKPRI